MEYRTIVVTGLGHNGSGMQVESDARESTTPNQAEAEARLRDLQEQLEQQRKQFQQELNAVREEASAERRSTEEQYNAGLAAASGRLAQAIDEFRRARDGYLAQVEREVVQLALAISERILHRQAQIDPLLLSGAVRVALGQLSESTEVLLRVPLDEQQMWEEMLRLMPNLPLRPQLRADERMKAGECTIETHLGSVDVGVRAQLAEIERGFFDLLEHRERISGELQPLAG